MQFTKILLDFVAIDWQTDYYENTSKYAASNKCDGLFLKFITKMIKHSVSNVLINLSKF